MNGRIARWVGILSAAVVVLGAAAPAVAAAGPALPPLVHATPSRPVPGRDIAPVPAAHTAAGAPHRPLARAMPTAGAVDLRVGGSTVPVSIGGLPVAVSAPTAGAPAATRVRVSVLDQASAAKARLAGVVLRLAPAAAAGPGRVRLTVNYAQFRDSYGADWADRLTLLRLPDCALSTPDAARCGARPIATSNNARTQTVSAEVDVSAASGVGTTLALAAGASGSTGDFTATSLSPTGAWQAGGSSGDFSWSYPLRVPPSPGGLEPKFALSYSSGAVDGRTASTNSQPSTVGEGWGDLTPGFIERHYRTCSDDHKSTSDLCWAGDNLTLSLNGRSTALVKDDSDGGWRPRDDDGSRIERLSNQPNGVNGGEAWRVTTTDGTQYTFGLNQLPGFAAGKPTTHSAWTVPVFGNDAGEPCPNSCPQAWRWNLDYVKDPHGDAIAYYYQPEANQYGPAGAGYTRGGYLLHADYGFRDGHAYDVGGPTGTVAFGLSDRCDPAVSGCTSFPDTPTDQNCSAAACAATQAAPTFWVKKRLTSVTTKVWRGSAFANVDQWALAQSFPVPGDGQSPALWLDSITHTGLVGGSLATPPVTFDPIGLQNRVNTATYPGLRKMRVSVIHTESGGLIGVNYAGQQCTPTSLPASPDSDTMQCFAQWWAPAAEAAILDWFHKHVVAQVTASDPFSGSKTEETNYFYLGGAAWHFSDTDETTPVAKRTWSEWRGYARVQVRHGSPTEQQSLVDDRFYRGMNGDHLANGGVRSATVADSQGGTVPDADGLAGQLREHVVDNGPTGAEVAGTVSEPFRSVATASHVHDGLTVAAYQVRPGADHSRVDVAGGGLRRTDLARSYDARGRLTTVDDTGDAATAADDRCVRTSYATDTTRWMLTYPAQVSTVAVRCSASPTLPTNGLPVVRTYYDDSTTLGELTGPGDATRTDSAKAYNASGPSAFVTATASYDAYGRVLTNTDGLSRPVTSSYTGLPVTTHTVTDAAHLTTTTTMDPAWGLPTSTVDANGRRTDQTYDPLGRLTAVWLPDRPKASNSTGNMQYAYLVNKTGASWVRTDTLAASSGYLTSYVLFDGMLRQRETQNPAEGNGRLVSETFYNTRGLPYLAFDPYFTNGVPASALFTTTPTQVPGETVTSYDGAERATTADSRRFDDELWHTDTAYRGDHVDITPPAGGIATSTFNDARGHETELRQYRGGTPSGGYDATRYSYDTAGRLAGITDAAGSSWTSTYDLLGRQTSVTDPDSGTATMSYDDAGQLLTHKDARGQTVAYGYDAIGRITGEFADSAAGPKLAQWTYDTVPGPEGNPTKGQPATATRFDGGNAYTETVTGYDVDTRPTGHSVTIPAAETGLAGTYTTGTGYALNGAPAFQTMPAAGGLPAETLRFVYDAIDLPFSLKAQGGTSYVTDSQYSSYGEPSVYTLSTGTGPVVQLSNDYEDGTHRLTRTRVLRQTSTDADQADVHYSYDPAGNLTSAADTPAGHPADTQCFDYDHLRRLTEAWTPASGSCSPPTAGAGVLGRPAPYWTSYSYDVVGDRTRQVRHDPAGNPANDSTQTYTYPAPTAAQPHTVRSVSTTGPAGSSTDSYGYDASGQTASRPGAGGQQTLGWDRQGHLASATAGGTTTTYTYDAGGNRLIERSPTGSTLYLPDGTELHRNAGTGAVTGSRYYVHNGSTVAVRTAAGVSWLAADPHGTATQAIAAAAGTVAIRRTDPFGNPRDAAAPAWPDTHGFLDKPIDPATGLTHVGARDYDPALGRFISDDPQLDVADPQQLNGYAYAGDSPTNDSDPTGDGYCSNGPDGMCHTDHGNVPTPGLSDSQLGSVRMSDHDRAVVDTGALVTRLVTGSRAARKHFPHARVTTDVGTGGHTANRIEGGERNGSGGVGYADVILWTDDAVYIWEIKPNDEKWLAFGRQQLDRYVRQLQKQLLANNDSRPVEVGFRLPSRPEPKSKEIIPSVGGGSLRIWSERDRPGLRIYAAKNPKRREPQPQEQEQEAPATVPVCRRIVAIGPCGPGMYPVYPGIPLPEGGKLPIPALPELPPIRVPIPIFGL